MFFVDFARRCCAGQHFLCKCMEFSWKNQQLEIQKSWIFSEITTISSFLHAKSPNLGRKPPICSPGQAKSSKNRRFAALAKRKIKKNAVVSRSVAWWYGLCPRGPFKIGPAIGRITPIKPPILRWDFLWKSYYSSQNNKNSSKNRTHSRVLAPRVR